MKRKLGFLLLTFTLFFTSKAQDSLQVAKCDSCHSVRKATFLSVILPGSGQIYNHLVQPKGQKKAFWKVPLIYATLGGASYFLISNQNEVIKLRREYRFREENPGLLSEYIEYDSQGLLTLENQSANFRDFSILGLVLIYAIQVADAAVEAHFVSFDVSEDLSFKIIPWSYQNSHVGLSLSLNFR
jgi:hypothetical protein